MNRPSYVDCIEDNHKDNIGMSWCGRSIAYETHFMDIDHAAMNGRNQGRLVACSECTKAIIKALTHGQDGKS